MSVLSVATQRLTSQVFSCHRNYRVANGVTIYFGSYVGMPGTAALTSTRGYARPYANQLTIEYLGLAVGSPYDLTVANTIVGNTAATPVVEVSVEIGPFVEINRTVTGVTAQSDVGKAVYLSNDNDMTLTAGYPAAIGRVEYWYSSTSADVLLYGRIAAIVI